MISSALNSKARAKKMSSLPLSSGLLKGQPFQVETTTRERSKRPYSGKLLNTRQVSLYLDSSQSGNSFWQEEKDEEDFMLVGLS